MEISKNFDTLKYAKKLKEAGVPEKQAEAEIEIWPACRRCYSGSGRAELVESNLATKADIRNLENELAKVKVELQKDIEVSVSKSKVEIIKWVAALLLAQAGLIFTLVKLFA